MHKYKFLLKNMGLLTLSNFGTKILSFILIPIYTSVLSTEDYGTYDVYATTVSLLMPILTLNIVEAVLRFTLDPSKKKVEVFSVGLLKALEAIFLFAALVAVNEVFDIIPLFAQCSYYLILLFAGSLMYDLFTRYCSGVERVADVAVAGALNSVSMLLSNVVFLVFFRWGVHGYFLAYCVSYIVPVLYLMLRLRLWEYFTWKLPPKALKTEMFRYSKPLVMDTLAWWINNASDRYIVTWLCSVAANGVYSVAYKLPSLLNVVQTVFNQAWTLSAVKEFNADSGKFYSNVYRVYNCGMTLVCTFMILGNQFLAKVLFAKEFYEAWHYAPFLMISVVFGALTGLTGGILTAAKRSTVIGKTTLLGAAVNTVLNVILVYFMGPMGAAIATLAAYVLVWATRLITVRKLVKLQARFGRDILSYVILLVQAIALVTIRNIPLRYGSQLVCVAVVLLLYKEDIGSVIHQILNRNSKE